MKLVKAVIIFSFGILFTNSAFATFINNADNTITDDVSGLDWLSLSVTVGQAYNQAELLNPGWRYASNDEVVNLFNSFFPTYTDNDSTCHCSFTVFGTTYSNQDADISQFQSFFGSTADGQTFGLYKDEDNILRMMGAYNDPISTVSAVYSDEFTDSFEAYASTALSGYSVYLVRNTMSAPEPTSIGLMCFGLVGLLLVRRRNLKN